MNIRTSVSRFAVTTFALAIVTAAGCGGGSGAGPATGGSTTSAASGAPSATGGNGGGGGTTTAGGGTIGAPIAPGAPATHSGHKRCAWIGADTFADGKASFMANPDWFDAIHPVWYSLTADGTPKANQFADDAELVATAKAHNVQIIPLVDGNSVDYMRAAMATPASIAAHAQTLATLAQTHGYDGLEMDYEHLWLATDRAPYSALVAAVAAQLHAAGKKLTLAVPALPAENLLSGYDYSALQQSADVLHLMGYDFHYLGGDHLGPIAPKGWINDVVTYVESLGAPQKFSLGVANYGIGMGWYTNAKDAMAQCQSATFSEQTDHMTVCPLGHQDAGLAPHCTTPQGDVWFENADSVGEKAALAKAHNLGGIAYYTLGDEPDGFFAALAASY